MKVVHIEARLNGIITLPDSFISKLPKIIALFTPIQLLHSQNSLVQQIEDSGRKVLLFKTGHTRHKGQILGCNVQPFSEYADEKFDAFVYVGDGLFHPKALIWKNDDKKVYIYNPFRDEDLVLDKKIIDKEKKRHIAALSRFQLANRVGVLITTKPGQFFLKKALELRKEYPDKEFFYVMDNTINFEALEDFPFVEIWVNTACPRIGYDDVPKISKPVVNLEDVKRRDPSRARIKEDALWDYHK